MQFGSLRDWTHTKQVTSCRRYLGKVDVRMRLLVGDVIWYICRVSMPTVLGSQSWVFRVDDGTLAFVARLARIEGAMIEPFLEGTGSDSQR